MISHSYLILGLGRTGRAAACALARLGHSVCAWDDSAKVRHSFQAEVEKQISNGTISGSVPTLLHPPSGEQPNWSELDLRTIAADGVVISPGIPHLYPAPHPCAAAARALGLPLLCDLDLWLDLIPESVRVIAVTGTNGKSTTSELMGWIASNTGWPCHVAGNFGVSPFDQDMPEPDSLSVLEISSYQLDLMKSKRLNAGILLNISEDHLDRHGGFAGYIEAKRSLLDRIADQGLAVIGCDDSHSRQIMKWAQTQPSLRVIPISGTQRIQSGIFCAGGELVSSLIHKDQGKDRGENNETLLQLEACPSLLGAHNHQNLAASYAVCTGLKLCDTAAFAKAAKTFTGLPHRQEPVAECSLRSGHALTFINDSKATNYDAAFRSLGCFGTIHWIVGGREKLGADPSEFLSHLDHVRSIWLIGEAAKGALGSWLQGEALAEHDIAVQCSITLKEAVEAAAHYATQDMEMTGRDAVVLLAPACSSFDQFKDFEQRGASFRDHARAAAAQLEQIL